ncbi:hypothetical protein B0J18DRAFT_488970 [Chaetomium sp. MPI-SDFR-AT-0129]|nr:hypothetical protein B0J18DRAFT_488970 [Chaetomium sp. MPI-SDFR-AT-0129]
MSQPVVQVLVHVAAPARASDDAKYRALAAAYFDFEPATQPSRYLSSFSDSQRVGQGVEQGLEEPPQTQDGPGWDASQSLGVIPSPMLSFRSVVDNGGSFRKQQASERHQTPSQPSFVPPPSVIEDSMPDNDYMLAGFCTPTRLLEHYTSTLDSSQDSPGSSSQGIPTSSQHRPQNSDSSPSPVQGIKSRDQARYDQPETVISQSPSEGAARRMTPTPTSSALDIIYETRIASSYPSQPSLSPSRAESEPPLPKRQRTSLDLGQPGPGKPLARSASDFGPRSHTVAKTTPSTTTTTTHTNSKNNNTHQPLTFPEPTTPLEILSPPPLTSLSPLHPADLITPLLAKLAHDLNLPKRYQPTLQTRPLRPFERGHWHIDCRTWDTSLKRSAWGFLTEYVGNKGAAGWGTSCRREAGGMDWVRVYCFGAVVGHMYLVVYLMSKRMVLETGVEWIGGDGKAVVVMGPRETGGRSRSGSGSG